MSNLAWVIISLSVVALLGVGACLRVRWVRRDLERLVMREYWWEEFIRNAKPLIDDADTPLEILEALKDLNFAADEPGLPVVLYRRMRQASSQGRAVEDTLSGFRRARPELAKAFERAVVSGFLATTYQSRYWGMKVRAIAMDRAHRARDETAYYANEVRAVPVRHHHRHLAPA